MEYLYRAFAAHEAGQEQVALFDEVLVLRQQDICLFKQFFSKSIKFFQQRDVRNKNLQFFHHGSRQFRKCCSEL